jgi:hypothetical protein
MPEGNRIFYNFVRPHMALDGQTPAEAAGIDLKLDGNKWMELIRQARQKLCNDKVPPAEPIEVNVT